MNDLKVVDDPVEYVTKNLNTSFSLSASAGCGKTYILIERVIALLKSGIDIEKLLLITFTDNAATEMRIRLSQKLESVKEPWSYSAIEQLGNSSIQTIHSFAFDICSNYFTYAGIDTPPQILDDVRYEETFDLYFSRHYKKWTNREDLLAFFQLASHLKIKQDRFKLLAKSMLNELPIKDEGIATDPTLLSNKLEKQAQQLYQFKELANKFLLECQDLPTEHLNKEPVKRINAYKKFFSKLSRCESLDSIFLAFVNRKATITDKRFAEESRCEIDQFEYFADRLRESVEIMEEIKETVLALTASLLKDFATDFRRQMFNQGFISHDDTIKIAAYLLETDFIRAEVAQKYSSILVDEFQDTDDHQIEIIKALIEQNDESDKGKLFVVGDTKQSIYSFRGAKVKSYSKFISTSGLENVALQYSYRTVPKIIDTVNASMRELIDGYIDMQTVRKDFDSPINNVTTLGSDEYQTASELRAAVGRDISSSINTLTSTTSTTTDDIAVLVRKNSNITEIVSELEKHQINFQIESLELIWQLTFSKIVLQFLNAVIHPDDDIAVVGTLKNPVFGCSNDDLYEHATSRNENVWNYLQNRSSINLKVDEGFAKLTKLNDEASKLTHTQLIYEIVHKTGLYDAYSKYRYSEAKNTLNYLLLLSLHYEESTSTVSNFDFIKYLNELVSAKNSPIKFTPNNDGDAIRIMTIHKSKGLEFPIVFLVPSASNNKSVSPFVKRIKENTYGIYIRTDLQSGDIKEYVEDKQSIELEDEIRMLYVGMTRAKDYLVLCTHDTQKAESSAPSKSGVGLLKRSIEKLDLKSLQVFLQEPTTNTHRVTEYKETQPFFVDKNLLDQKILRGLVQSPSSLEIESNLSHRPNTVTKLTQRRYSNLIGTATHKALNLIDFGSTQEEIETIARSCAKSESIEDKYQDVLKYVKRAIECELIASAETSLREVPVSGMINETWVEGYIDLLIKNNDGWNIVDYKTDVIDRNNSVQSKVDRYQQQLLTYSSLLEQCHNFKIENCYLLFLNTDPAEIVKINATTSNC